jgi:hypothetical protein
LRSAIAVVLLQVKHHNSKWPLQPLYDLGGLSSKRIDPLLGQIKPLVVPKGDPVYRY